MGTIDLNRLVAFGAVAEHNGFSSAAIALGLPKSSLSRAVGALEQGLGVRLFNRTTRRVALTSAGATLYARVAPQLESLRRATEELPERSEEPSGLLRVSTLADLANEVVGEVTAKLAVKYPRIEIELVLTPRPVDLVAERIDAAVRLMFRPLRDSALMARKMGRVQMALYAAPSYLDRRGRPKKPEQLVTHDWIAITGASQSMAPIPLVPRIQCNEGSVLRTIMREGGGIGGLPSYLGDRDVEDGLLERVLPRWASRPSDIWLVTPGGRQVPKKLVAFRDELSAAIARRPLLAR